MKKGKLTFTWRGQRTGGGVRPAADRKLDKLREQMNADAHTKRQRPSRLASAEELLKAERTPYDGKPYYCALCGAGWQEYNACEEPDCKLEDTTAAYTRAFTHKGRFKEP